MLLSSSESQKTGDYQSHPFGGALPVVRFDFEQDQDRDFDKQPDDWTRRRGEKFPTYVKAEIDRKHAHRGNQSLRFDVNGGMATYYSPIIRIDSLHSYVFRGFLRTQGLKQNAAVISLSFLNHRRERIRRILSKPVTGTHHDWVKVRVGPLSLAKNTRFVVIGCHLLQGKNLEKDIRGSVWFDDLWMGRLPTLRLVNNFRTHFKNPNSPIVIRSFVSGLDPRKDYSLNLAVLDSSHREIASKGYLIKAIPKTLKSESKNMKPYDFRWELAAQPHGFYQVKATLERENKTILEKKTTFAVMDLVKNELEGEFGWSISTDMPGLVLEEFADIASQAGINWLKFSVWKSVYGQSSHKPSEIAQFFDTLGQSQITGIAVLTDPPTRIRNQFATDWSGISEIFSLPEKFWWSSLEPVVARYGSRVRHWQLGDDRDTSFAGMSKLDQVILRLKKRFDLIGRNTLFLVNWRKDVSPGSPLGRKNVALIVYDREEEPTEEKKKHKKKKEAKIAKENRNERKPKKTYDFKWIHLKPRFPSSNEKPDFNAIAADLVKRMVEAKKNGAKVIFATDIFHEKYGLLNSDGSPTPLFLPWRSTALTLQGTKYLGSFHLPHGSKNHVFLKNDEVILLAWNSVPTIEEIYLGDDIVIHDLWGRKKSPLTGSDLGRQKIQIGPNPIIVRHCSKLVAQFRLSVGFQLGILKSQQGEQRDVLNARNTFRGVVGGNVKFNLPNEWDIQVPGDGKFSLDEGERLNMPLLIKLPPNTNLGRIPISIDFELDSFHFRVYRNFNIGIGDVGMNVSWKHLDDGRLRIEQFITNNTNPPEILNFRCSLFVPGQRRRKAILSNLDRGVRKITFDIPNYDSLVGKNILIRAEQLNGKLVLNYHWILKKNELNSAPIEKSPR